MSNLKLTYGELLLLTRDDLSDRFEIIENDIPKSGHSSQYIEDDGRQLRQFEFKDLETNKTYSFSYVWHRDYQADFPWAFLSDPPSGIEFVKESELFPVVEKPIPVKILTPEEQADAELKAEYNLIPASELRKMTMEVANEIPASTIITIMDFLKKEKFNIIQLRKEIYPVCIKFKIDQKSFWTWLQVKRGIWKESALS